MKKARTPEGGKNLINQRLKELREENGLTMRDLASQLKEQGYNIDRNIIWRIENDDRYVTDIEVKAFVEVLGADYGYLIEGKKPEEKGE